MALEDFTATPDSTVILDSTAEESPDFMEAADSTVEVDFMEVVGSTVVAAIVDFGGTPKALSSESAFCLSERVSPNPCLLCLDGIPSFGYCGVSYGCPIQASFAWGDFFPQIGSC
jgi:hypothetical protein